MKHLNKGKNMVIVKNFDDYFMYLPEDMHFSRLLWYRNMVITDIIKNSSLEGKHSFNFHIINMPETYIKENIDRFKTSSGKYVFRGVAYTKQKLIALMKTFPYRAVLIYT